MANGQVKWFSSEKGYGFIVGEDGEDRYFNIKDLKGVDLPQNGDKVTFTSANGKKGLKAINISITNKIQRKNVSEKVTCAHCGKTMIPRIITGPPMVTGGHWTPVPIKSICPFCGVTHQEFERKMFGSPGEMIGILLGLFVFIFIALAIFSSQG